MAVSQTSTMNMLNRNIQNHMERDIQTQKTQRKIKNGLNSRKIIILTQNMLDIAENNPLPVTPSTRSLNKIC